MKRPAQIWWGVKNVHRNTVRSPHPLSSPEGNTTKVNIHYLQSSGKQSKQDMHTLHDDDGSGP